MHDNIFFRIEQFAFGFDDRNHVRGQIDLDARRDKAFADRRQIKICNERRRIFLYKDGDEFKRRQLCRHFYRHYAAILYLLPDANRNLV